MADKQNQKGVPLTLKINRGSFKPAQQNSDDSNKKSDEKPSTKTPKNK